MGPWVWRGRACKSEDLPAHRRFTPVKHPRPRGWVAGSSNSWLTFPVGSIYGSLSSAFGTTRPRSHRILPDVSLDPIASVARRKSRTRSYRKECEVYGSKEPVATLCHSQIIDRHTERSMHFQNAAAQPKDRGATVCPAGCPR